MFDFWNSITAVFNSFDGINYAIMAVIVVGAGFMLPNMTAILTATFTSLAIYALAEFTRAALVAKDAQTLARADWNDLLALPLHTLSVYATVFACAIAFIYALRSFASVSTR